MRVFLFAALLVGSGAASATAAWQAGVARENITPKEPMWLAGYGARNRPADGTLHELWARALVLQDGAGRRCALVTLDLVGIDRGLSQSIAVEVKKQHGIDRAELALCSSHTHSGPVVGHNLRSMHYDVLDEHQQTLVRAYTARLEGDVVALVGRAIAALAPCEVAHGLGRATLAVNRRANREADVPALRAQDKLQGPVDHDVPVLAVRSTEGKLIAVAFGYACHATVLNGYQWSGDYPGVATSELERRVPGCQAMFWAGCGGDQNPLPRRSVELAERYGRELADAVEVVLSKPLAPVADALDAKYVEVDLKLDKLPTTAQLEEESQSTNRTLASRAKALLAEVRAGRPIAQNYPYPIQRWRLGDEVDWLFLGGEVVVDYALRLKTTPPERPRWVAAYANDVMAYIPSRRVLFEGGYEGTGAMAEYGLPAAWAADVEETIVKAAHALSPPPNAGK